jgi:hypothetical protein
MYRWTDNSKLNRWSTGFWCASMRLQSDEWYEHTTSCKNCLENVTCQLAFLCSWIFPLSTYTTVIMSDILTALAYKKWHCYVHVTLWEFSCASLNGHGLQWSLEQSRGEEGASVFWSNYFVMCGYIYDLSSDQISCASLQLFIRHCPQTEITFSHGVIVDPNGIYITFIMWKLVSWF